MIEQPHEGHRPFTVAIYDYINVSTFAVCKTPFSWYSLGSTSKNVIQGHRKWYTFWSRSVINLVCWYNLYITFTTTSLGIKFILWYISSKSSYVYMI